MGWLDSISNAAKTYLDYDIAKRNLSSNETQTKAGQGGTGTANTGVNSTLKTGLVIGGIAAVVVGVIVLIKKLL
jgi:hypothetical protein